MSPASRLDGRRDRLVLGMIVATMVGGLGACAASGRHAGYLLPDADALAGWRALEEGGRLEADAAFARVVTSRPRDPLALVGRAALAYERGATDRAVDDEAAALAAMVAQRSPLTVALAPVAAGQLAALYDELSVTSRGRLLQALRPAELARSAALPWTARLELARLAEHAARLDTAPDRFGRRGRGGRVRPACVRCGKGRSTAPPRPRGVGRWVGTGALASGARLGMSARVASRRCRSGRRARAARGGRGERGALSSDCRLRGAGEVSIDGGPRAAHGSIHRYGPRVSAFAATLTAGRHELELRLGTDGPSGELAWLLVPETTSASVKFIDPRAGRGPVGRARATTLTPLAALDGWNVSGAEWGALADYTSAYLALRIGAVDDALEAAARLRARPARPRLGPGRRRGSHRPDSTTRGSPR